MRRALQPELVAWESRYLCGLVTARTYALPPDVAQSFAPAAARAGKEVGDDDSDGDDPLASADIYIVVTMMGGKAYKTIVMMVCMSMLYHPYSGLPRRRHHHQPPSFGPPLAARMRTMRPSSLLLLAPDQAVLLTIITISHLMMRLVGA